MDTSQHLRSRSAASAALAIAALPLLLAGVAASHAATPFQSFEDATPQGWQLNTQEWAGGFDTLEVVQENASEGTHALSIGFEGREFRWGAFAPELADPALLDALQHGGTLFLDLYVPPASAGIQHLGFSLQQPDVTGAANWQQVWFFVGGATGSFTIELPFTRPGTSPITLHLGQNATLGATYAVYVDNFRVESNPAPPPGFTLTNLVTLFSFEDGTPEGFEPNTAGWGNAFTSLAAVNEHATDGAYSLQAVIPATSFQWGAYRLGISDPGVLSELSFGGTLLLDVHIPEDTAPINHLGVSLNQPGVAENAWQQVWFFLGGATGDFTIDLPFTWEGASGVEIHLGRNMDPGAGEATIFLDHLRLQTTERIGGIVPTIALSNSPSGVALEFTGLLQQAASVTGPFAELPQATSPITIDPTAPMQFYRTRGMPGIAFEDDLEAAEQGWTLIALPGDSGNSSWELGTPGFAPDFSSAHSGANCWGTGLSTSYGENVRIALRSPVIDLTEAAGARLRFYHVLDVGGQGDTDQVAVFVRDEQGNPITGAGDPIYQNSEFASAFAWQRIQADLPSAAAGRRIRLEFQLTTDGTPGPIPQLGWFIDDVRVVLTPET